MADSPDRESKTEEASPRRIEDALAKGNSPFSRELGNAAALLCLGLLLPFAAPIAVSRLMGYLGAFIDRPSDYAVHGGHGVVALAWFVAGLMAVAVMPLILALMATGILASGVQNSPRFVVHRIRPDPSRLSPAKGLARMLGGHGRVEFIKALVKLAVLGLLFYLLARGSVQRADSFLVMRHDDLPRALVVEISRLFLAVGLCAAALAIADVIWTRLKWRKDLRMSPHELKEEQKQADGDPIVRARQRSLARERARRRMIAAVPRATLVVVNPTHYAVALRYVQGESAAPIVLAKGVDHLALRIREIAEEREIPVIEDRDLARSLFQAVATDRPIPPEFYRAVAEIILHLMGRQISNAGSVQPRASQRP
jgi:flagellar biosynthetic protein FlhB